MNKVQKPHARKAPHLVCPNRFEKIHTKIGCLCSNWLSDTEQGAESAPTDSPTPRMKIKHVESFSNAARFQRDKPRWSPSSTSSTKSGAQRPHQLQRSWLYYRHWKGAESASPESRTPRIKAGAYSILFQRGKNSTEQLKVNSQFRPLRCQLQHQARLSAAVLSSQQKVPRAGEGVRAWPNRLPGAPRLLFEKCQKIDLNINTIK